MTDDDFDIYLASGSPRRRELLEQIGISYRILMNDIDEIPAEGESAEEFAVRIAIDKAVAASKTLSADVSQPVLSADTVVCIDKNILGKPRDKQHAKEILQKLSGQQHQVHTAVALIRQIDGIVESCLSSSEVSFREISDKEIEQYWLTGEPQDKAGAYAIQGIGAMFVRHLSGSYSGVMGLPLYETAALLNKFGINTLSNTNK
ncbi:MAG: Maf-like protein [Gammaproteobacteria bacterium]|nr:Maf-like protein [Gammaproteobacteria bacterium]MDH5776859.1 Maf-like protein [Gammaproteobacteria bacterium]